MFNDFNADPYDIGTAPTSPISLAQKIAIALSFLSPWMYLELLHRPREPSSDAINGAFLVALVFGYMATMAWCAFRRQWAVVVVMLFYATPFATLLWLTLTFAGDPG